MKVRMTFDIPEVCRRAVNYRTGDPGLASYADLKTAIRMAVDSFFETVCDEWYQSEECEEELIDAGVLEPNYGPNDAFHNNREC